MSRIQWTKVKSDSSFGSNYPGYNYTWLLGFLVYLSVILVLAPSGKGSVGEIISMAMYAGMFVFCIPAGIFYNRLKPSDYKDFDN